MQDNHEKNFYGKDEDLFKQLVNKYFPYWPLYIFLIFLFLTLALGYTKITVPVYEAYSAVVIKDESKGLNESEMMQELNLFKGKKIVENEIEILKSHSFIADVVTNLGLYAEVFEEEKFRVTPAYLISPIRVKFKDPNSIKKLEKVPFSYNREKREITIGQKSYPINQWVNTRWGQISFLPNFKYNGDTLSRKLFFRILPPKVIQASILNNLKVVPASKLATVINLSIKDEVPDRAEDILNELVKVYTDAEIDDKNMRAANTVAMVENRIKNVAGQLDSVENVIQRFRSSAGVIDISSQGRQYLDNIGQYDREVEQLKNQIAILDEVEKFIVSKDVNNAIVPSALGINDPVLNQMLDKLNDYQMQFEKLKRTTGENSPVIVSVKDQIDQLRPGILENIRNQRINLNISKNNFSSTGSRYSAMLSAIPQKEKQLIEISRQQSIKNQLYGFLLEKREEAALSFISSEKGDTRIIDKAYSSVAPVSPNKFLLYLAAIVFGFTAGIIIISLKEALNKRILFRQEVSSITGIPIIGEILFDPKVKNPFVVLDSPFSPVSSHIKSLRNHLFFGAEEQRKKTVLVTSVGKNEGKSFISSNLAIGLAMADAKVVLIDLDFYQNKVTQMFEMHNSKGVSDFLKRNVSLESVTHPYPGVLGLSIIPVGMFAENNVSEMLVGEKFKDLLKNLEKQFDCIVLSCASVSEDVNTQAISQIVDASLIIIRQGETSKANFNMLLADRHIELFKQPAFVFNAVKGRGWGIKMFGNGFGYGNIPKG